MRVIEIDIGKENERMRESVYGRKREREKSHFKN